MFRGVSVLDLDYAEDAGCETDMNVVMTGRGAYVEVQGTAEGEPFDDAQMTAMMSLARKGVAELVAAQKHALAQR
jgi:ribonuclease PH